MTSIDYEKANDIVPNSRKVDYLLMYKISNKVIKFISKAIIKWDIELTVGKKKTLAEVKSREASSREMTWFCLVLWRINRCRLFYAKSIFM